MKNDREVLCPRQLEMPKVGIFPYDAWVEVCDTTDDSVDRTIKQYDIPVLRLPGQKYIDAAIWWARIYAAHPELVGKPKRPAKG